MKLLYLATLTLLLYTVPAFSGTWVEGVPIEIQKSDYQNSIHAIFIRMQEPVSTQTQCDSQLGIVIHDSNPSSEAAITLALTALASGSKFRCYINAGDCSKITGAATTFPVCDLYPTLVK